jgi:DNA polymerase elongation subunit (family B)
MGQLSIRFVADRLNKKLNKVFRTEDQDYVAYIDTDSVHLKLETAVEQVVPDGTEQEKIEFLQKTGAGIGTIIKDAFKELGGYTNNIADSMNMECEAISRKALWTGKKRYVLNVVADEDRVYPHAKNKIMGLEIKRSSTPDVVKPYIERSIELILAGDIHEFRKYINECKNEFYTLPPEDIAFPRGVSSISKFIQGRGYSKGTPIAVRAAILYNNLIEEKMITDKYSHMTDGSKIKFLYLTMPNTIHENVIGFNNALPKEFGLDKYVDYDLQFSKTFIEPVEGLLKYIGWTIEEKLTLF